MSIDHAAAPLTSGERHTAAPSATGLVVRAARHDEAQALSALALRSKGWWGYSASFLRACEAELTLTEADAARCVVIEVDGVVAGFHLLSASRGRAGVDGDGSAVGELDMLFVDARGCIVTIKERARPQSLETIESRRPVVLVVEIKAGVVAQHGIRTGDRVLRLDAGWPGGVAACVNGSPRG